MTTELAALHYIPVERAIRLALRRLRVFGAERDDLVQDVWIEMLKEVEFIVFPAAFANAVVRNLNSARVRSHRRHPSLPIEGGVFVAPGSIQGDLERRESNARLVAAVAALRNLRGRGVMTRYLNDEDKVESCAAMGITGHQYDLAKFRSIARLRGKL